MKKILVAALIIVNTSFIDMHKKYWQGITVLRNDNYTTVNYGTVWAEVIEANTEREAMAKFNTVIIKQKVKFKGCTQSLYNVYEIKPGDIIK